MRWPCCELICLQTNPLPLATSVADGGGMTDHNTSSLAAFDAELTTRLFHSRIIVFGSALDDTLGNRICHQLFLLSAEDQRRDITLWINSPGGSVSSMLAIMDVMRLIPNDVRTLAMGIAASAGQFVLTSGTPGKRFALPHSRILMHQGSAGIGGTAVDIAMQSSDLRDIRDICTRLTAEQTGQSEEVIHQDSLRDQWYTAEQAQAYGFIDHIVTSASEVAPVTQPPAGLGVPR